MGITYHGDHNYSPDWEAQKGWPELYSMVDDPQENYNLARREEFSQVAPEVVV